MFWDPIDSNDVRWTFMERFIIDANGKPYIRMNDRRNPYSPGSLRDDIQQYFTSGYIDED